MRRRWPNLDVSLLKYKDSFPPIIQNTTDKTSPTQARPQNNPLLQPTAKKQPP